MITTSPPAGDRPSGAKVDARVARTREAVLASAVDVLLEQGWDQVTHARVARAAGCSKVTVYTHWPERADLLREALARVGEVVHHVPVGDLRSDLVGELRAFRAALVEHRLDRVLAVLADRREAVPELREVRARFVADGERVIREIIAPVVGGAAREAVVAMLNGAMVYAVSLGAQPPDDHVIDAMADVVVAAVAAEQSARAPRLPPVR